MGAGPSLFCSVGRFRHAEYEQGHVVVVGLRRRTDRNSKDRFGGEGTGRQGISELSWRG